MLTVFTVASHSHELYVLPYLACVLANDQDAVVEIVLEDPARFAASNTEALALLDRFFEGRYALSPGDFAGMTPNTLRFLATPTLVNEHVYIGDIDILVLEPIAPGHLEHMARTGLPYSNVTRPPKHRRLSGRHFTRWDAFYPRPPEARLERLHHDEATLFDLVTARGLPLPDPEDTYRPVHGFHLSLNRDPRAAEKLPAPTWCVHYSAEHARAYARLRSSAPWRELAPHFDVRYQRILFLAEAMLATRFRDELEGTPPSPGLCIRDFVDGSP